MSPCFVVLLLLPLVTSQNFELGYCPTPRVQTNFSMDQFLGRWYTIMQMPSVTSGQSEQRCISSDLERQMDHSVLITTTPPQGRFSHYLLYEGREDPAKMDFHIISNSEFLNALMPIYAVWMLQTDYRHMAVLYSCKDVLDLFYVEMVWVLGRERTLPSHRVREALDLLEREGIDASLMIQVEQSGCEEEEEETTLPPPSSLGH